MANVALEDFLPEIEPEVEFCPLELMLREVRNSLRRLCEFGLVWRYLPDETVNVANQRTYPIPYLSSPATDPVKVLYLAIDDTEIKPKTVAWLDRHNAGWRTQTTERGGTWYTQVSPANILLVPYLSATGTADTLNWEVALMPALDADAVDEQLYIHWRQAVGFGAKAALMMMPNKRWSNKPQGLDYYRLFQRDLTTARAAFERSFTGEGQKVYNPFGNFAG